MPRGDSVSTQPTVHVFWYVGVVFLGIKAPSLKSNPEPSCSCHEAAVMITHYAVLFLMFYSSMDFRM